MLRLRLVGCGIGLLVLVACGGGGDDATPTPSPTVEPTATPEPTPTRSPTPRPTATPAPTPPPPADPLASIFVNGYPPPQLGTIDEEEVGVVTFGSVQSSGVVPILLRNNTAASVINIGVSGIARASDGSLLSSGKDQGIEPQIVGPGEVAFGYVYLARGLELPTGSTIAFSVTWEEDDVPDFSFPLQVTEVNFVQDRFVGIVYNPWNSEVSGPASVDFICLDEEGRPLSTMGTFTDGGSLAPEGTSGFQTFSLYGDPCPFYLVASSGRSY